MRHIDADKLIEHINNMPWKMDSASEITKFIFLSTVEEAPTADVVPKSEVENFNKSKGGFCPLCGSYTITQEMMEELRMAHKEPGQHGDPVGEKGVNALEAIKAGLAREIFEEIEKILNLSKCYGDSGVYFEHDIETDIAELKKKYIGGNDNG